MLYLCIGVGLLVFAGICVRLMGALIWSDRDVEEHPADLLRYLLVLAFFVPSFLLGMGMVHSVLLGPTDVQKGLSWLMVVGALFAGWWLGDYGLRKFRQFGAARSSR